MTDFANCDGIVGWSAEANAMRAVVTALRGLAVSVDWPVQHVVSIDTGSSNLGRRYALARLDCGHAETCVLVGTKYRCAACNLEFRNGTEDDRGGGCPDCGGTTFNILGTPDAWNPEHQLTKVGDALACKACDHEARGLADVLAACAAPDFSHLVERDLTAGGTGAWWSFLAYRVDKSSPTQCSLVASCPITPKTRAAVQAARLTSHVGPTRGAIAEARICGRPSPL